MSTATGKKQEKYLDAEVNSPIPYLPVDVEIDKGYLFIMKNCNPNKKVQIYSPNKTPAMARSLQYLEKRLKVSNTESRWFFESYAGTPRQIEDPNTLVQLLYDANAKGIISDLRGDKPRAA